MNKRRRPVPRPTWVPLLVIALLSAPRSVADPGDDSWPRFRGADGNGLSSARNLPLQWSDADVRWKTALPGKGHSSPVVWKDRLFVTSGKDENADRFVLCLRAADGQTLWTKQYSSQTYPHNRENSFGTSTPAVEENGVYVYWTTPATTSVAALTLDGREKWRRDLGPFKGKHGSGASPVVVHGLVWINHDHDGPSALLGLDAASGDIKFKIDRRADKVSYGTPCLVQRPGQAEELVFAASSHGLTSINPRTGAVNWDCTNLFSSRIVSSPITSEDLVICSSGEGGVGRRLVAVRPPAGNEPARVVYDFKNGIPNVPTPLAQDGRLFILCENGLLRCVRTATGEPIWQQKLGDQFYASPVWAEGRLYLTSKRGAVFVVAAADRFELLAQNSLGEPSFATPAIAHGTLFFRTASHLLAVGGKKSQ